MPVQNVQLHNRSRSTDQLLPSIRLLSHRHHAVAVDMETNVLIMRPFPVAPQFIIAWPAGCQHTHTAHSNVGPDEPTGSGDQRFYVGLVFMPRGDPHTTHAFHLLRAARSAG